MMTHSCQNCKTQFEITDGDLNFYSKIQVPPPTFCPECRYQRRLANRNEWNFYKRDCSLCGGNMVSIYNPSYPGPVYCGSCWWSDKWDPFSYGQDFDFNKPFFEQFDSLNKTVPKCTIDNFDQENSDYCNYASHLKDCYMLFGTWHNEKCLYGNTIPQCLETNDSLYTNKCRYSYELIDCEDCYELFCAQNCSLCSNSYFLYDCKNCSDCILCWNLRNKNLHILNKPVSKEEFSQRIKELSK